ncbi:MAG: DMT family transporter [Pseudomonadota bacterium]
MRAALALCGPVMVTVTMWAFQAPALHDLGKRWDPGTLNLARYVIASAAFGLLALALPSGRDAPALRPSEGLRLGALFAGFGILFTLGTVVGNPVTAATVSAVMPIMASLVTWAVTRAPPDRALVMALPLVVPGAVLATPALGAEAAGGGNPVLGLLFILLAQTSWSLYSLSVPRWMPASTALARTRASVLWSLPFHIVACAAVWALGIGCTDPAAIGEGDGVLIAVAALGPLVLGVMLWNRSIERLGLPTCALFLNTVPVIGAGIAALFGSPPTGLQLLGIALVIAGMGAAQYRRRGTTEGRPTLPRS